MFSVYFGLAWSQWSCHSTQSLSLSLSLDDSSQDKQRKDSPGPKSSVTLAIGEGHKISSIDLETRSVFDYGKSKVWYFSQPDTLHWLEKIKNYKSCMTNIQKDVG